MRARENELHEPELAEEYADCCFRVVLRCSVCHEKLVTTAYDFPEVDLVTEARSELPNYCPHCGARLTGDAPDDLDALLAPCKIGQIVFLPEVAERGEDGKLKTVIHDGEVQCFNIEDDCQEVYVLYSDGLTYWHSFDEFGKDVFTDEKKAQERLDEMIKEESE